MAYLAYFDESGDSGTKNSPTRFFVLSCILVSEARWMEALNEFVKARRILKKKLGIPSRGELKATHLRKGTGPLSHLRWSVQRRMEFYERLFVFAQRKLDFVKVFSIVINKGPARLKGHEARETAWQFAIQRLHRFSTNENNYAIVFPDEGHGQFIRQLMRRMRRFHNVPRRWGGGTISFNTERVVEDPNDRRSHDSYFIQFADWCAFAAHRSKYVDPHAPVRDDLWDALAGLHLLAVNKVRGGPPGMVIYP
jgi:hypothetical protein